MINHKEIILGILTALVSITAFWFWRTALPSWISGDFTSYANFALPILGLLFSASFFSISALFVRNQKIIYPTAIIVASLPYFFLKSSPLVLSLLVLSAALAILAIYKVRKEYNLSLGFSMAKFLKAGLPLYFTVAAMVITAFYLADINEKNAISTLLPKTALDVGLKTLSGPLGSSLGLPLPALDPEATVDKLLEKVVSEGLKTQGIDSAKLPRNEILKLIRTKRSELSDKFGIKVKGDEKVGDLLYGTVTGKTEDILGPYKIYLPYASAVAFFLAFKALTFFLYYVTLLITFLLIKVMVLTKIVRSEKVQLEVKRLIL